MGKPNGLQHNDSRTQEFILMNFEAVVIFLFIVAMIIAGFLNQVEKQEASNIFASIGVVMLIIFWFSDYVEMKKPYQTGVYSDVRY